MKPPPGVLEVIKIYSNELTAKAKYLRALLEGYVPLEKRPGGR